MYNNLFYDFKILFTVNLNNLFLLISAELIWAIADLSKYAEYSIRNTF